MVMVKTNEDPNRSDAEGVLVSQATAANFADSDGDVLTYSATGLPTGLTINTSTGAIGGTLSFTANANSPYSVVVTARDPSNAPATQAFTWIVTNVNQAPNAVGTIANRSDLEGVAVNQATAANFGDADGETLAYSATGLPTGLSISASTGAISGTLSFTANANSPYSVVVTARDPANASATQAFTWTVPNVNRAPTATAIADGVATAGVAYTFVAGPSFADPDGDVLTFSASGLPDTLTIDPVTGEISGTPIEDDVDVYTVTVTATDTGNATGSAQFELDVRSASIFSDGFESP